MRAHARSAMGLLLAGTTLALTAPLASAQCPIPDNLNGPCWDFTALDIPSFPGFALDSTGICWDNCVATEVCTNTVVTTPAPTGICGQFSSTVNVSDCAGISLMAGAATLDYTRTWHELDTTTGREYQVWRFLTKIDFFPTSTAPVCPVPVCAFFFQRAYFYGYIDYARECITGSLSQTLVLYHACDLLIHRPGISDAPGAFHPTTSFAVVGPDTAANPFVPTASLLPGGPLIAEAVRNIVPGVALCQTEEPIAGGLLIPIINGCLCPLSFGPIMNQASRLAGSGVCIAPDGLGSSFTSINLFPLVPWLEMVSTSLGEWTTDTTYPGKEKAHVNEGLFAYHDGCKVTGVPGVDPDSIDIFYGASTTDGYMVLPDPVFPLTQNFVDLATNFSSPASVPVVFPIIGSVRPTDHLIYVNVP